MKRVKDLRGTLEHARFSGHHSCSPKRFSLFTATGCIQDPGIGDHSVNHTPDRLE